MNFKNVIDSNFAIWIGAFMMSNVVFLSLMMYEKVLFSGQFILDFDEFKGSVFASAILSIVVVSVVRLVNFLSKKEG